VRNWLDISVETLRVNDVVGEVVESRAHIRLAYNPPAHPHIEYRGTSPQPVVLLVHAGHPEGASRCRGACGLAVAWN
jgi:hypothetical protein